MIFMECKVEISSFRFLLWMYAKACACMQVLLALQRLVNALGMDSPACYNLLLPILHQCTSIDQVQPSYNTS